MDIFMNQGRDSTIEPAYLAEKKQIIPEPEPVLIEKTYEVPIPEYLVDTIKASDDNADGYSQVTITGPSQEDIDANWASIVVRINPTEGTATFDTTNEQLTTAYQNGKRKFYVTYIEVQPEI